MWAIEVCGKDGTIVQRTTFATRAGMRWKLKRELRAFDAPHLSFTFWECGWRLRVQGPRGERWGIGDQGGWHPLRPTVGSPAERDWKAKTNVVR